MITGVAVMAVGILLMKNIEKPVIRPPATPTHIESLNRYQTVNPRPEKPSVPESTAIARVVRAYYAAVQNKDVDGAISMYDPAKIPGPDRDLIARVAKDTEHYEIESIQVTPQGDACTSPDVVLLHLQSDACASADVVLHHKKVRGPEQTWDVHMTLVRRNASWKIWTMQ